MSNEIEAKIDVINSMITALGKLTNAEIRMTLAGNADLAQQLAAKQEELRQQIDVLQGQVADQWSINAAEINEALRKANAKVQEKILNIKKSINVAQNAIKIIGQVDDALAYLKKVVG
jgi:hypothetical protein